MKKRLMVYDIPDNGQRLNMENSIRQLDNESIDVVQDHAIAFHSDMTLGNLIRMKIALGVEGEVWFFEVCGDATGIGPAQEEVKQFMRAGK